MSNRESTTSATTKQQRQRKQSAKQMFSIPIEASSERRQNALLGQMEHHGSRRLARNEHRRRLEQIAGSSSLRGGEDSSSQEEEIPDHHPGVWRQSYSGSISSNNSTDRHRDLKGLMTDVGLSNCHLVLYSGQITLGSPPNLQHFRVDFDTAGSDLWVPSKLCDGTCSSDHPTWSLYDPLLSSTYEVAATDVVKNAFALEYQDGEAIKGEHAKDTLRLGDDDIRIPHQVFAHVTHIQNFATCEQEEGILGLANSMQTTHGFPSLLGNIMRHSQKDGGENKVLPYNIFGMYLRSDIDDYEGIDVNNELEKPRESSELILGGINQEHYLGCLQWHSLLSSGSAASTGGSSGINGISDFDKYWSIAIDDVKVGGTSLNKGGSSAGDLIAVLDSGSSYIVGPQAPVAHMVQLNGAKCFRMDTGTDPENPAAPSDPTEVDCNDPNGFDGAVLNNCDDPFFSVEFIIDGRVYVLEKEDLMVHLDTLFGTVCIMRVVASQGMNGWILGDAFLNKYYTAFDFENQKLGLALSAESADDRCERDNNMDVNNFWKNVYGEEDIFDPDEYQPDLPGSSGGSSSGSTNNNDFTDDNGGAPTQTFPSQDPPFVPEVGDQPATSDTSDGQLDDDFFTRNDDDMPNGPDVYPQDDDFQVGVPPSKMPDDDNVPILPTLPQQMTGSPTDAPSGAPTEVPRSGSTDKGTYNDDIAGPITDYSDDVAGGIKDYSDDVARPATDYTDDDGSKPLTNYNDDNPNKEVTNYDDDNKEAGIQNGTPGGVVDNWEDDDTGIIYSDDVSSGSSNGGGADETMNYSDDVPQSNFDPTDFDDENTGVVEMYDDNMPSGGSLGSNEALYDDDNSNSGFIIAEFDDGPLPETPPTFSPHHENPERPSIWNKIDGSRAPGAERDDLSFIGIAGIVLVCCMTIPVVAFLLNRRKRKQPNVTKQDQVFNNTYNKAEKKMLKEHRNLNYRNHPSPRSIDAIDVALDELSYVDEDFRDEEGGKNEDGEGNPDFVLDANILQRMN